MEILAVITLVVMMLDTAGDCSGLLGLISVVCFTLPTKDTFEVKTDSKVLDFATKFSTLIVKLPSGLYQTPPSVESDLAF